MPRAFRLLIVEDSQCEAERIVHALHEGGLEPTWKRVETAEGLRAALAAGSWDGVVSDYTMPGFVVTAALEVVRAADQDIPFIVISDTVGGAEIIALMRAGVNDCVPKDSLALLAASIEREVELAEIRRAKRAANHAVAQLAAIVASSDDAIMSKNLDGVFTSWNPAAERLYGWTAAEAIGRNVSFIVPPDKTGELVGITDRVRRGERIEHFETVRMHRNGQRIDESLSVSPVRNSDGLLIGMSKTARDIRERKRAEAALLSSEERYRGLIESIPALVWVYDAAGKPLLHNQRWYDYTGQTPETVAANRWHEALHPDDAANAIAVWDRCAMTGDPYAAEYRIRRTDGVYRWFLSQGTAHRGPAGIEQWCGICTDIDDRKRAEQRLKVQNAVVSIFAESADLKEAAPRLLRAVCETTGWDVGDLWVVDRPANVLTCVDLWHGENIAAGAFRKSSLSSSRAPGEGLAGRVWAAKKSVWFVDITEGSNFQWAAAAAKADLRGGFGFPIQYRNEVLGVLEFFSRQSRQPDKELLRMFDNLGSQIGQFIERKRVEAGLRLFRALIDQTMDGIEVIEPETGRYLDVNEKACVAHGYTRAEYLSLSVPNLDPLVTAESWEKRRKSVRLAGAQTLESRHRRKDGSTFPVEINFNTIHLDRDFLVAVVRDITERKQAEEALQSSQQRLRHVIASSPAVLFTLAVSDDQILGINWISDNFREMLGYPPADAVVPGWWMGNIHPEDREGAAAHAHEAFLGQGNAIHEFRFRHRDGSYRWTRGEIRMIRDDAGRPVEGVGSWSDITERRHLEEQFRQAQKMEAIGQLAGGVAHDFNNLLTIINGYSEMLLQSLAPEDPSREMVDAILKAGERSAGLTRQLLAFSRQQILAPRVLQLNEVITDTEKMLRRLIGEDIRLTASLAPSLWVVQADPGQIEQVLMNLAVNARDAMPRGGRLTIQTSNVELDETYARTHPGARAGSHVLLSVTDDGTGMSPDVKAQIFEPFFTTKQPGKGTGLGLACVYGIVKQSGGHVLVESEVGVGTTFKVYLPRAEQAAQMLKTHGGAGAKPRGTETVLLVEDEDRVRALTRYVLAASGYTVLEAAGGVEADRVMAGHNGPIHLLISDVVMPGAGGRAVAEQVMERHPNAKVLFISGYTDDAIIRHGVLRDGVNFLQKPFSPTALAFKVREVLDTPV